MFLGKSESVDVDVLVLFCKVVGYNFEYILEHCFLDFKS